MKILITGADGQLAKTFLEIYHNSKDNLILLAKKDLDITNIRQAQKKISKFLPDIVLHFASMTRGDECAKHPRKAYKVNVLGTKNIVDACKKNDITLLFISTNEVFDGKKKTAYTELDIPNPITVAGKTKYEAEKVIMNNLKKYYIVRTSWLFSRWSNNFLSNVMRLAKNNKEIRVVTDEISSPTYSIDLCLAIRKLITSKKYGTYHVSNTGRASRFEFAKKAFQIISNTQIKLLPITFRKYKRLSNPPLFTPLNNKKIKKLGIKLPKWEVALKWFLLYEA